MTIYGSVPVFDCKCDEWVVHIAQLRNFFIANNVDDTTDLTGEKRRAILLNCMSQDSYRLIRDLLSPVTPEAASYTTIVSTFNAHFDPKKCVYAERKKFYTANKETYESVSDYAARLRGLATKCSFGSALDMCLTDRFVLGLELPIVQEKLFTEDASMLNLTKALEIAAAVESAHFTDTGVVIKQENVLHASTSGQARQGARQAAGAKQAAGASGGGTARCQVCGGRSHATAHCGYGHLSCNRCGIKGHLKRMCTKSNVQSGNVINNRKTSESRNNYISEYYNSDVSDNTCDYSPINNIRALDGKPMYVEVRVRDVTCSMEVDSGSAVSAIPAALWRSSSASELISRRGVFSRRQYGSVEQLSSVDAAGGAIDAVARRYRLENGNSLGEKDELFGPPSAPVLENPEFQTRWYFKYFLGKMHQNYIGVDGSREPYLLSVVQEGGAGLLRAILFNKMGAHKIYLPPSAWNTSGGQAPTRPTIKQILAQFPAMERVDKVPREITCAELQKDILLLEEQEGSVNFKIGVMLMNPSQKTDDEMLSNEKGDEKWDRFISLLGDKIRLRGWNRFRGGLDVKGDMTGSHSIYTMHQGHEIMFHVSTMLPFSKDNKQQLERKRHIGNDIVNIVFTDDSVHNTFNPQCVKSHFTHIFAVVSEVEGEGYRLSVYSDDTVPPFGPSLPCPPVFNDPQLFREFLLVKLMNGEKAAFQTPTFALKRQRTLDTLIRDIYAEHCSDHKVPMLSRRALSDVWSGGAGAAGAGAARTERFLHVGQALKLDAVLRGDAPTSLVSTGSGGSRRAPWEGRVWRAAPLPASPVCAEQMTEGRLLLSTTSNTYILEESGTTRVVLRWEGCVRAARVSERAGLFRVGPRVVAGGSTTGGAGGAGLYALPVQELCAGAWAMRPLQDCKHARLPRTKTAHYFDLLESGENGKAILAIAVGRRVMIMTEESKTDSEMGFEYTHIKDIQLSESPVLIKLMDGEVGIMVVGYKHHWEVLESSTGQPVKRAENSEDSGTRRGTLVNALRIGDERDGQIVLCYNHTCHFERLTTKGLENDGEYDFHWTTVPAAVVCAFPYIMAFAEDLLEIRLVANGSLVHAACIPGLKMLCGRRDIFYVACAPEYIPLSREIDPCLGLHDYELMRQMSKQCGPYSLDEDDNNENKGESNQNNRTSENNSTSSRSSSVSSEQENIRPPLQRMAPISPPNSPQVLPENSGRCVRIYKIPQSNLSAGAYQRQSVSADQVVTSYFSHRPNSIRQRLAELRLDSKSRGGGEDETL